MILKRRFLPCRTRPCARFHCVVVAYGKLICSRLLPQPERCWPPRPCYNCLPSVPSRAKGSFMKKLFLVVLLGLMSTFLTADDKPAGSKAADAPPPPPVAKKVH